MGLIQAAQFGERLQGLFSRVAGSNFYEQHPFQFEAAGEKGAIDTSQLRDMYLELFQDIAASSLGREYTHSVVPSFEGTAVVHPTGVRIERAKHHYFFNQWAFLCQGRDDFPLIPIKAYDSRISKGRHFWSKGEGENKTNLFLRFTYGTKSNKQLLFDSFEEVIRSSGLQYERQHPERRLESIDFDIEFDQAYPQPLAV
ncbi:hypothetical protein HYT24_01025 [Candidatus Pacearchaeota archaeon]|nr:hypothetical protein [Candidatus Pacearchaeota archaeon]